MTVPIENVYYLLCYAWDHVQEGETVDVGSEAFGSLVDLFAKVLNEGVSRILSRGLDRDYLVVNEDVRGLKGKLDLGTTIKRNVLLQGKTHCGFDELNYDVPQNQILKATLRQLTFVTDLDPTERRRSERLYGKLDAVSDVRVSTGLFRAVRVHRNNQFYSFLLHLCYLIHENLLVNEETGTATFYDFRRDEARMGLLFEQFVRTFYVRESGYAVSAPKIDWFEARGTEHDLAHLPGMQTDLVLESPERTIIIDTKFYANPLDTRFGGHLVLSNNLYQIFAYVMNRTAGASVVGPPTEGWLLYAAVDHAFDYRFKLMGRSIRVCSIDLAENWTAIRQGLIHLLDTESAPAQESQAIGDAS